MGFEADEAGIEFGGHEKRGVNSRAKRRRGAFAGDGKRDEQRLERANRAQRPRDVGGGCCALSTLFTFFPFLLS